MKILQIIFKYETIITTKKILWKIINSLDARNLFEEPLFFMRGKNRTLYKIKFT